MTIRKYSNCTPKTPFTMPSSPHKHNPNVDEPSTSRRLIDTARREGCWSAFLLQTPHGDWVPLQPDQLQDFKQEVPSEFVLDTTSRWVFVAQNDRKLMVGVVPGDVSQSKARRANSHFRQSKQQSMAVASSRVNTTRSCSAGSCSTLYSPATKKYSFSSMLSQGTPTPTLAASPIRTAGKSLNSNSPGSPRSARKASYSPISQPKSLQVSRPRGATMALRSHALGRKKSTLGRHESKSA